MASSPLRLAPRALLRARPLVPTPLRRISQTGLRSAGDGSPRDTRHTVEKAKKGDKLDVQTEYADKASKESKAGKGGHATEGSDSAGGKANAKKDFPEAPDPAIGMQDERGGRGGR